MKNEDFYNTFRGKSLSDNYNRLIKAKNNRLDESNMMLGHGFVNMKPVGQKQINESIESELENIGDRIGLDFAYVYEDGMTYSEFEEQVDTLINQTEVIYYRTAMEYLMEYDVSLTESLEIAGEYGYKAEDLNSETLATLLKQQKLREAWYEVSDEVEDIFNLEDEDFEYRG